MITTTQAAVAMKNDLKIDHMYRDHAICISDFGYHVITPTGDFGYHVIATNGEQVDVFNTHTQAHAWVDASI